MKHCMKILGFIFLMNAGLCYSAGTGAYDIQITTYGDDALVQAIQQYSNLTKADVDAWKFSWAPLVGDYVRNRTIDKIRNFVKVCNSLAFVNAWYQNEAHLMQWMQPGWNTARICLALKNLEKQAEYALALLAQVRALTNEEKGWSVKIDGYLKNIQYHQNMLQCSQKKETKKSKEAKKLAEEENKAKLNKIYWENMNLKWKMTKDMGANLFKGTKWLIQAASEYQAPILSAGAAWFVYNKLFGLPQQSAQ